VYDAACVNGHLHVVQWLVVNRFAHNNHVYDAAASRGHLHVIKWLYSRCIPFSVHAIFVARKQGYIDVCAWFETIMREESDKFERLLRPNEN
jgi:hypothetical protein